MKTIFNFSRLQGAKTQSVSFLFSFFFIQFSFLAYAQEKDTTLVNQLDEVLVFAVRATPKTPIAFSNLDKKDVKFRNLGQDIPVLMNYLPSVVSTTDAGNGVGYTGIRVRGSDATRVNVTINGIPYNDSESHGTFWVNMPDFASSVESLQLQRGVGTSTNGAGAFGASLNMLTDTYSKISTGEIANSFGSFGTRKHTIKFSTGLLNDYFEIAGRLSALKSDGYIDRAFSDLKSYFLQGTYIKGTTLLKALAFGGDQKTYQAWNGLKDLDKLKNDRTFNPAGMFTDELGTVRFYDNETDNYKQDHYQLHWNERVTEKWSTNLAFHYTKGKGYYENYKENAKFSAYGLTPIVIGATTINKTDLIRQKWLVNDFYGTTFSANYKEENWNFIFGGGYNKYEGNHFGRIIWARYASKSELDDHYYDDAATKTDGNIFAKANFQITQKLNLYGDLQLRNVQYKANSAEAGLVNDSFTFFNPKAGLNYQLNAKNALYFSYARANREPNRSDYENGSPRPEKLNDFELGLRHGDSKIKLNANVYYMAYKDQLIVTGALDDVGAPIRENSGNSYRFGLELDATVSILDNLFIRPNATISTNKNKNFFFERDGVLTSLGDTNIAFSPDFIAGNIVSYIPKKNLHVSFLSKYVGEQYMANIDSKGSKLKSYFINDINISYEFIPKSVFKSIYLSALVNNIFNYKYISNGFFYTYDDDESNPPAVVTLEGAGYYPQAGINFLIGLTLKF